MPITTVVPVQEAPDPGHRYGGEQREHRHAGEDADQDALEVAPRLVLELGGRAKTAGCGRLRSWSGATETSAVAVITIPCWLGKGAGRKSAPHNRGHGPGEYAYVTVAYGSVGYDEAH